MQPSPRDDTSRPWRPSFRVESMAIGSSLPPGNCTERGEGPMLQAAGRCAESQVAEHRPAMTRSMASATTTRSRRTLSRERPPPDDVLFMNQQGFPFAGLPRASAQLPLRRSRERGLERPVLALRKGLRLSLIFQSNHRNLVAKPDRGLKTPIRVVGAILPRTSSPGRNPLRRPFPRRPNAWDLGGSSRILWVLGFARSSRMLCHQSHKHSKHRLSSEVGCPPT